MSLLEFIDEIFARLGYVRVDNPNVARFVETAAKTERAPAFKDILIEEPTPPRLRVIKGGGGK